MKVIVGHGRDLQCCLAVSAQFKGRIDVLLAYFSLFNFKFAENVYLRQVVSLESSDSEKKKSNIWLYDAEDHDYAVMLCFL